MKFDDLIKYKALHFEYLLSGESADFFLDAVPPEEKKKHLRNVCALVSLELFDRLESTCQVLGLSKRQFIESALVDCLDRAAPLISDLEEKSVLAQERAGS